MTKEEIVETAHRWFDHYKDNRVAMAFLMPNQTFTETIYECSRKYYTEERSA